MRSILIAVLLLAGAFALANVAFDHYLVAQCELDLARAMRGQSRLSFDFEQPRDLIGGSIDGARRVHIIEGVLHAELPSGVANVRLNLRGLALDASRFSHLDARIHLSAPAQAHLIFDEPGKLEQQNVAIDLVAGWNELQLELAKLDFQPHQSTGRQRWGGDNGLIGELRLYLSGPPGLLIGLDHLRFGQSTLNDSQTPPVIDWIDADQALGRLQTGSLRRPAGSERLGILLNLATTRPEQNLLLRERIRQIDADAVFWPRWRGIPAPVSDVSVVLPGWTPGWWLVLSYALLAIWIRWRSNCARRQDLLELVLGMAPILALTVGLGLTEQTSADTRAWLACALLFQLSGIRTAGSSLVGSRTGWAALLKMLALISALLLLTAAVTQHWQIPGWQRIGAYLPFVLVQQALLLGFLWPRLQALAPTHAHGLTALIFGLAHAPNFALMCLCMLAAWWWTRHFKQYRSWLPIVATHYLLGLLVISCLPGDWLYSAETGLRYFQVR